MTRIIIILSFLLISCYKSHKELPIFGRKKIIEKKVNGLVTSDTIDHMVSDFKLINQDGDSISNKSFQNSIYIADFFFTTCPTICPIMKSNLLKIHDHFINNENIKFLSHTINPEYDNVERLNEYSKNLGVSSKKWHFVTGDINYIHEIAKKSYMVTAMEDSKEPGGFLHSGTFLLVDRERRIRGVYDGTDEAEISKIKNDIEILLESIVY